MIIDRDYEKHNEESKHVWEQYYKGDPIRMPMLLGVNPRVILLNRNNNPDGITYRQYFRDPEVMIKVYLEYLYYMRHSLYADHEMGLPKDGWEIYVDKQNVYEAGWLGAPIVYPDNSVPYCEPFLNDDNKGMLFKKGIPGLFDNFEARSLEIYEAMLIMQKNGYTFKGLPIKKVNYGSIGTDGPMTVACMIRGAENFCVDLIEDPVYASELLDFLTEAALFRIKGLKKYFGFDVINDSVGYADDSIALLSCEMYQEKIFPFHKKLYSSLVHDFEKSRNSIHLCGDATRHFKFLRDKLNVVTFDTGFPVNFGKLTKELGSEITIKGGVKVEALMHNTPEEIEKETKRIIDEVKPNTKKFVFREANNLSPNTPIENVYAMYQAVCKFGRYN